MNKSILTLFLSGAALMSQAADFNYYYSHLIDTQSAQDAASQVVCTSDGSPVTFSHFGSKAADDAITYAGEKVAIGAATSSTSDNRNLLIMKHDTSGKALWAVSTKEGYCDTGSGNIAATSDGGVVVLLKLRGSQNTDVIAPVFVDSDGEKTLSTFNVSAWIYNMVVMKISANGVIEWIRPFDQSQLAVGTATKDILDGINPNSICVDADNNIYIGGNYRTPVIAKGANYSCYALAPRNVENYTGDSQTSAGGMFLVKLDDEGNYLAHLKVSGSDVRDQVDCLDYSDGKIYFCGNILGKADDKITIGGKEITLSNELDNIVYGELNSNDLTANYVSLIKAYGASDGKHTTQCKRLKVIDGAVYMVGAVKGGFGSADSSSALISTSGKQLEGFTLKCNAADGTLKSGHIYGSFISAYMGVFKHDGRTYLYGYRMNAAEGAVLECYTNDDSWTADADNGKVSLIKGGGAPIAYGCAFDPTKKMLYALCRGNNVFTFHGTEAQSEKPTGFGGVFAAYGLDKPTNVVEAANANQFSVQAGNGELVITAGDATQILVCTSAGTVVADTQVKAGVSRLAVAPGVYMVNGQKVLVK